jgi:two-component system response regulator YesN
VRVDDHLDCRAAKSDRRRVNRQERGTSRLRQPRILEVERMLVGSQGNVSVTLCSLSRELGVTAGYLGKLFKRRANTTFRNMAMHTRQRHALMLLNTTDLAIKEIAAITGYKHVSDFSSCFKKVYGVTPGIVRTRRAISGKQDLEAP